MALSVSTIIFLSVSVFGFAYFSLYGGPVGLLMFIPGILVYEFLESKSVRDLPPIGLPSLFLVIGAVIVLSDLGTNGWWKYAYFIFCFLFFVWNASCSPALPAEFSPVPHYDGSAT
jgi:hypothetical protein